MVWVRHSRKLNNKFNNLHERVVYKNWQSTFEELLIRDKSVNVHHKNLQILTTEIYKAQLGVTPVIMNEIFRKETSHITPEIPLALKLEIPKLFIMDQKELHIYTQGYGILLPRR